MYHCSRKTFKNGKIANFGCKMLQILKKTLRCQQIFCTLVLHSKFAYLHHPNAITIQNLQTVQGYFFRTLQHFTTKLCKFTIF